MDISASALTYVSRVIVAPSFQASPIDHYSRRRWSRAPSPASAITYGFRMTGVEE